MKPYPWAILLGWHGEGMTPEEETQWARVFVLLGFIAGAWCSSAFNSWFSLVTP